MQGIIRDGYGKLSYTREIKADIGTRIVASILADPPTRADHTAATPAEPPDARRRKASLTSGGVHVTFRDKAASAKAGQPSGPSSTTDWAEKKQSLYRNVHLDQSLAVTPSKPKAETVNKGRPTRAKPHILRAQRHT